MTAQRVAPTDVECCQTAVGGRGLERGGEEGGKGGGREKEAEGKGDSSLPESRDP